jgi:hypothetical protein
MAYTAVVSSDVRAAMCIHFWPNRGCGRVVVRIDIKEGGSTVRGEGSVHEDIGKRDDV